MKLFLLFLLALSAEAHAQKSLTPQVFQVNVRPVLSAILNDFYQMMNHFPDFPKELGGIIKDMESLHDEKELIREKCPRILNANCLENINILRTKLSEIQVKTQRLLSGDNLSTEIHMVSLAGIRTSFEFQVELEEAKGILDNASFMIKARVPQKKATDTVIKQLDEMSTYASLTVVEFVPYLYKEDFRHLYLNFIQPLQVQIARSQNYEFVNKNLDSLNFAFNLLNQNLTKRGKKTPEGMAPYLSLMHNRWNSLLRYYY